MSNWAVPRCSSLYSAVSVRRRGRAARGLTAPPHHRPSPTAVRARRHHRDPPVAPHPGSGESIRGSAASARPKPGRLIGRRTGATRVPALQPRVGGPAGAVTAPLHQPSPTAGGGAPMVVVFVASPVGCDSTSLSGYGPRISSGPSSHGRRSVSKPTRADAVIVVAAFVIGCSPLRWWRPGREHGHATPRRA